MLRLTLFLCAAMFAALMVMGEDRGQMRPGLANAVGDVAAPETAVTADASTTVIAAAPASTAVVQPASAVATVIEPVVAPEPIVEPLREVVQALEEPVFTLASLGNEVVPGEDESITGAEPSTSDGIWYVNADSVNVRAAPSTEAEVLDKLTNGEATLMVEEIGGEWARIVIQGDGLEGYVALRYLSPEAP